MAVKSELIIKSSRFHSASERTFMKLSDLALFRIVNSSVMLIKSDEANLAHKLLIAVDANREDEKYKSIFEKILGYEKTVITSYDDGELHIVHAYTK